MDDERTAQAEFAQGFGKFFDQVGRLHTHNLCRSLRGIGERAQ